jgi:hypothetical protein
VVCEQDEFPALQHVAEMTDAGETGPQLAVESGVPGLSRLKFFGEKTERLPRPARRRALLQGRSHMFR